MGVMQAIVDARPSRRAMLNIANTTWLQAVVPFFSELSIMFPMVYGPCFSECWLGLPFTWGPAKIYCSMAANEIPAPTFWVAVFLPELPVYTAISHALPNLLKLALPQFLWIPVINVEIAEWISMISMFIENQIPASMINLWEQYEIWPIICHYFEPFILRWFDIFRCSTDCIFLASLVYVATFGRLLALFAASLGAITGILGDLWLDLGHACLQFDSALVMSTITEQSPSMIVM